LSFSTVNLASFLLIVIGPPATAETAIFFPQVAVNAGTAA
jgi:hypothetical protein